MNKIAKRLLVFFIGVPVILILVFFKTFNHLPLNIAVIIAALIAVQELYIIIKERIEVQPLWIVFLLTFLVTFASLLENSFKISSKWLTLIYVFSILFSLIWEIIENNKTGNFSNVITRVATTIFIIFYIPFLLTFISKLTILTYSREFLVLFFLLVFGCDSFAWLFGVLFGKTSRGVIAVSPNKSLAGFIGGILSSIAISYVFSLFFPAIFMHYSLKVCITGFCTAIAAVAGDLAESGLKRSANVKDSGTIMPGRGGLLDSIDSILFAAPVYYILILFFFV